MKDGHFIYIAGWMGNCLELRGNELICFALIYSFSQDGESQFRGKLEFLAGCMFATKQTAFTIVNKLLELNLILKVEDMVNGKKRCYYQTNIIYDRGEFIIVDTSKEPLTAIGKESLTDSIKESITVYNNNKDIDNKKSINKKRLSNDNQKKGGSSSRFVKPTIEQIEAYIKEKGYHFDAERFWNHYESKGWKVGNSPMKNWKAACATWESIRKSENINKGEEQHNTEDEDRKLWEKQKEWLQKYLPNIAPEITQGIMMQFRHLALCDKYLLQDTLEELNKVYDGGDIVERFKDILNR